MLKFALAKKMEVIFWKLKGFFWVKEGIKYFYMKIK